MFATKKLFQDAVLLENGVKEILRDLPDQESHGDWSKGYLVIRYTEPQGGENFRNVWYITNSKTGETSYQTANTLDNTKNEDSKKVAVLTNYLKNNFFAFYLNQFFIEQNWVEATVYIPSGESLEKKTVFVYKLQNQPITHKFIV